MSLCIRCGLLVMLVSLLGVTAGAAQLQLLFPLNRVAYQTNELIDISVVRSDAQALPAGTLALVLSSEDGSQASFSFAVKAVPVANGLARTTEHLHVNGAYLRPGRYTVQATADGAAAQGEIAVYNHIRKSTFRLGEWASRADAKKGEQRVLGEDGLGFNILYSMYGGYHPDDGIRTGLDYMRGCAMGGGHQIDLRMEKDWSDPYVLRSAIPRGTRQAMRDRTYPNTLGVHLYDEPGLTWFMDPITGAVNPHTVLPQWMSFEAAFGDDPTLYRTITEDELVSVKEKLAQMNASEDKAVKNAANRLAPFVAMADVYRKVPAFFKTLDGNDPAQVEKWTQWAYWKLGFMDAVWKYAQHGITRINGDFLALTQAQYAPTAFTDGHYFNVMRSLPINSGHGGYDSVENGYFNPIMTLEVCRAHDLVKDNWYLPVWYGSTESDVFRLEQYTCFMTGIQGLFTPPDIQVHKPDTCKQADAVVESNKITAQLGTIFNTMPVTRPPVALLYSLSHQVRKQANDTSFTYGHMDNHWQSFKHTYTAGQMMQQPFLPVLDEDVMDGTVAAHHRAIIVPGVTYLAPAVVAALEAFAADGGLLICTADTTVAIKGAVTADVMPGFLPEQKEKIAALEKEIQATNDTKLKQEKQGQLRNQRSIGSYMTAAAPVIKALQPLLATAGLAPVFTCNEPGIMARRQGAGDIEYLFAVNAAFDYKVNTWNALRAATATIGIQTNGRPVYDAVRGGTLVEFGNTKVDQNGVITASYRFGGGQMRVFALTARPIGGVKVGTPRLSLETIRDQSPSNVTFTSVLLDNAGGLLAGSAPLRIVVTDPLGVERYRLFRATEGGLCSLTLPLAANDPAGAWTVNVTELLNNTSGQTTFSYKPALRVSAAAGATRRAVTFGNDRDNIFRLFREQQAMTIVLGAGNYTAAAERLVKILAPWGITCTVINAADINKEREVPAVEKITRTSMRGGNWPIVGAAILLGTPEDNPMIKFAVTDGLLPYAPKAGAFPGAGRGFIAWQRDMIGSGQESVTLIAHDEAGMAEAVGSFYEAVAGIDPLSPLAQPVETTITPAVNARLIPQGAIAWTAALPDRARWLTIEGNAITAVTQDGALATLDKTGKMTAIQDAPADAAVPAPAMLPAVLKEKIPAGFLVKTAPAGPNGRTAVAYWGGLLQTFDADGAVALQRHFEQDISALAWDGPRLIVALADGRVLALEEK